MSHKCCYIQAFASLFNLQLNPRLIFHCGPTTNTNIIIKAIKHFIFAESLHISAYLMQHHLLRGLLSDAYVKAAVVGLVDAV